MRIKSGDATPGAFRPIRLISFLLKAFQTDLDPYVRENLVPGTIAKAEHAYVKGKPAERALYEVVSVNEVSLEKKGYRLGINIDIEGFSQCYHK